MSIIETRDDFLLNVITIFSSNIEKISLSLSKHTGTQRLETDVLSCYDEVVQRSEFLQANCKSSTSDGSMKVWVSHVGVNCSTLAGKLCTFEDKSAYTASFAKVTTEFSTLKHKSHSICSNDNRRGFQYDLPDQSERVFDKKDKRHEKWWVA